MSHESLSMSPLTLYGEILNYYYELQMLKWVAKWKILLQFTSIWGFHLEACKEVFPEWDCRVDRGVKK